MWDPRRRCLLFRLRDLVKGESEMLKRFVSNVTMRVILGIALTAATIASAAVLPPSLLLELISNPTLSSQPLVATLTPSFLQTLITNLSLPSSILPDARFKVSLSTDLTFLPVSSTLMNILYFMSLIATQDFTSELQPRTYSTPDYRDVEITTYAWTETRFLLWGVFSGINYMIEFIRFHDMKMDLFWEGKLVGRMKIAVKKSLGLAGNPVAQLNSTGNDEESTGSKAVVANVTASDSALLAFDSFAAHPYPPGFTVDFSHIVGATRVNRNDLFLTFYTALLRTAEFPAGSKMGAFFSKSPNKILTLHMEEAGVGCTVSRT